jgi:hypothetical protein
MNNFKDLGITADAKGFKGDKIKLDRVINLEIRVVDFKVEKSKVNAGNCLHMQIELNGIEHVIFTGSSALISMIQQVPKEKLPFRTTIVRKDRRVEFS